MLRLCSLLAALMALAAIAPHAADAYPQFQKVFVKKYTAEGAPEGLPAKIKSAKCYVCHQGKKKKNKNLYGQAVDELLGRGDKKDTDKIMSALEEVAAKPSVADDKDSPTFGKLLSEGKLPVDLETAKKEPSEL